MSRPGSWTVWTISADRKRKVGPCGCWVPNTFEGLLEAREHECPDEREMLS